MQVTVGRIDRHAGKGNAAAGRREDGFGGDLVDKFWGAHGGEPNCGTTRLQAVGGPLHGKVGPIRIGLNSNCKIYFLRQEYLPCCHTELSGMGSMRLRVAMGIPFQHWPNSPALTPPRSMSPSASAR